MTTRGSDGRAVVVGDALIDEVHSAGGTSELVGGAALNVAVGLAILGVPTTLVAMIGEDDDGRDIRSYLEANGVELVATVSPLGTARAVSHRVNGEPTYSFNRAARERSIDFDERVRGVIDDATLVLVSSFPFDDAAAALGLASAIPRPASQLIIDANPRQGMLNDRDAFRQGFERAAITSRLAKIGDEDAALLYESDVRSVAAGLIARGASTVFATEGRLGASILTSGGSVLTRPPADLPGEVIDTMGAGDATLASMAFSILGMSPDPTDDDWLQALDLAMLRAAATVRTLGATLQTGS